MRTHFEALPHATLIDVAETMHRECVALRETVRQLKDELEGTKAGDEPRARKVPPAKKPSSQEE